MVSPKKGWEFADASECLSFHYRNSSLYNTGFCNATWDGFLCWPFTQPGVQAKQLCPENVKGILRGQFATRRCSPNGFWLNEENIEGPDPSWTNFTGCFTVDVAKVLKSYFNDSSLGEQIKIVSYYTRIFEMVGLSVSFISILASLCILSAFRSLRTREKSIHRQLYLAMLIQVIIRLVLYTDQLVSRKDLEESASQTPNRGIDNTPYLCESFYVLLEYARTAMFHWFFIEGLHLHNVLTIDVFPASDGARSFYYIIGWGLPVLMTSIWAIVTGYTMNHTHCWYGYNHTLFYWIVEGPRLFLIAVNLLFLLNILRVLLTKLKNNSSSETMKVRKAVKAAIVLQPLLGITNSIQMLAAPDSQNIYLFILWSVITHFLSAFQGFFAALFYCFLNGEVRSVLSKYCQRLQTQRDIQRSNLKRRQSSQVNLTIHRTKDDHYQNHTMATNAAHQSEVHNLLPHTNNTTTTLPPDVVVGSSMSKSQFEMVIMTEKSKKASEDLIQISKAK